MELPIQIMIVLFVSIIVGSSVILFSTDLITDAKKIMHKQDTQVDENLVIELAAINDRGLAVLMANCFKKYGQEAMEKTLCYVIRTEDVITTPPSPVVDFTSTVALSGNTKTLYVYYNPNGHLVEVHD